LLHLRFAYRYEKQHLRAREDTFALQLAVVSECNIRLGPRTYFWKAYFVVSLTMYESMLCVVQFSADFSS